MAHFLAAANSDDPAGAARQFVSNEMSEELLSTAPREQHVEFIAEIRGDAPPISLCRIESTADDEIVAILGGINDKGEVEYGRFFLAVDGEDARVSGLGIEPATKEDLTRTIEALDDAAIRKVVHAIADGLGDYVFADKAKQMQAKLRSAVETGDYAGITSPWQLAKRLTAELVGLTGDKHLHIVYSPSVLRPPRPDAKPTPEEIAEFKTRAASDNFGMPVAEIRDGNVGYLLIRGFFPPRSPVRPSRKRCRNWLTRTSSSSISVKTAAGTPAESP